jgi:hypothetical protein
LIPSFCASQYSIQTDFENVYKEQQSPLFAIEISDAYQIVDLAKITLMYSNHQINRFFGLSADVWGNEYYLENNWFGYFGLNLSKNHATFISSQVSGNYLPYHKHNVYDLFPGVGYAYGLEEFKSTIQILYREDVFRTIRLYIEYDEERWRYSLIFNEYNSYDLSVGLLYFASSSFSVGFSLSTNSIPLQIGFTYQPSSASEILVNSSWKNLIGIQNHVGARFHL